MERTVLNQAQIEMLGALSAIKSEEDLYVVIDTNCLVQMLSAHGSYHSAWLAYRRGEYVLCVSNEILNEYQEIIERVANAAVATNVVNADFIVSEDSHFNVLETISFPSVKVIRLNEFVSGFHIS